MNTIKNVFTKISNIFLIYFDIKVDNFNLNNFYFTDKLAINLDIIVLFICNMIYINLKLI